MTAKRQDIVNFLNDFLAIRTVKDASCNGLQVEGRQTVSRVGLAVDACMAVYKKAVSEKCQMLIVHHGIIWNGLTSVRGATAAQLRFLLSRELNLYAAHLPLDMHPDVGNNAMLARMLKLSSVKPFGDYKGYLIGCQGVLPSYATVDDIGRLFKKKIGGSYTTLAFGKKKCRTVAIVSGGGSDAIPEAIEKGIDCFVTGEPDHSNHHAALESKLNVVYLGHYHSEKPGVMALGKKIEAEFGVQTTFLDVPTLT
jgi:dinuclear metal center YbgI/SA1388 family protein